MKLAELFLPPPLPSRDTQEPPGTAILKMEEVCSSGTAPHKAGNKGRLRRVTFLEEARSNMMNRTVACEPQNRKNIPCRLSTLFAVKTIKFLFDLCLF